MAYEVIHVSTADAFLSCPDGSVCGHFDEGATGAGIRGRCSAHRAATGRASRRRPRRAPREIAGSQRRACHLPASRAEREGSRCRPCGEPADDAEGRTGRLERDDRRARARLLHLLDCGRWHDHQRPGESPGSDVVQQFPVDVRGAGLAAVAASCRRGSRCHRPARVPFDDRERRPRLLRIPAPRVRRTARAAVPGALSAARPR